MLSETVRLSYAVLCLNLSGPSDMEIIRKAQSRHKMRVSQTSASKLNKAMCHFPDASICERHIHISTSLVELTSLEQGGSRKTTPHAADSTGGRSLALFIHP